MTNAAKAIGNTLVNAADQVFGVSSMVHDFQTIFGGNASLWEKLLAGGDLFLNSAMDISMFMGAGEFARGLYAIGRAGGEMLIKDLTEQASKEGEKGLQAALESCGGLSFSASTGVATASGEHAIVTLKVGEKVLAYNPKTKKMELQPILHVWINHDNDLVDLTITSTQPATKGHPAQQVSEMIHTNKKHPFLTVEAGFVTVANLSLGMHIVRADGAAGMVTAWQVVPGTSVMYNLEVAQDHTFAVGDGEWVVHNCTVGSAPDLMNEAANASSYNKDLTEVGQAMQKHSQRANGADMWGPSNRKPSQFNADGASFVEDLLTNPDTNSQVRNLGSRYDRYGNGGWTAEMRLPDGRGARWTADWKTFIGFINP